MQRGFSAEGGCNKVEFAYTDGLIECSYLANHKCCQGHNIVHQVLIRVEACGARAPALIASTSIGACIFLSEAGMGRCQLQQL